MKLGILGSGKIVQEFLPWLTSAAGIEVMALCSTPRSAALAQQLCAQYHIPHALTDYAAMLAMVDTVYIATPNLMHAPHAIAALKAGCHVIVEKPMAASYTQAQAMAQLARSKGLFLFEAVTTQYLPNYRKLRELLPRVGPVKLVQCNFSQYSSRYDRFCAGETPAAFDPAMAGGALMDLNVYNISYVVGLFGEPRQVAYTANIERGIDTSGILTMDYDSFKAVCVAAKDCAAPVRVQIQGTKGYLLQKTPPNLCGALTYHPNQGQEEHYSLNGKKPRQAAEFEAFARAIDGGDQELCARMLDTSLAVSRVLTRARQLAGIVFPCDKAGS